MLMASTKPRIVILGAGLGGTIAAYEIRAAVKDRAEVTLLSDSPFFSFTPSNPWVAVRWREPDAIQVELPPILARKGIAFSAVGAARLHPDEKRIELKDGSSLAYDYLVIATGPALAFDEVEGLGPEGFTQSICTGKHAADAANAFDRFLENPRGVVPGTTMAYNGVKDAAQRQAVINYLKTL